MNHLDDGTIHAWLDGAVDATQARDIETHVATCATCSAAVAEARGLIAGASRILIALDDVPAGVIPKRAPTAPTPGHSRAMPRREWRAARWVTGIAAALMLAVGITTWNRGAVQEQAQLTDRPERRPADSAPAPLAADKLERVPVAASAPAAAPLVATPNAGRAATTAPPAGARPTQNADTRVAAVAEQSRKDEQVGKISVPAPAPVIAQDVVALADFTGCYRTSALAEFSAPTSAQATAAEPRLRRQAAAPSVAPAREKAEDVSSVPALVRLDSTHDASGYAVRGATTAQTIGSWEPLGRDSVQLTLGGGRVLTLPRAVRTSCP
jgi:hypothetical protein